MKRKIESITIALLSTFSFSLTSCGKKETAKYSNFVGTHQLTATETDKYLVKDGQTDYKLIIPDGASIKEKTAREEFAYFFKAATNIEIPFFEDDEINVETVDKYISIGDTKLAELNGVEVDRHVLKTDGVRIVTKGNNIFLLGAFDSGTLYAVYDFMEITFHYNQYKPDYFEIDTDVKDQKLLNYDVLDIPDFDLRANGFDYHNGGSTNYDYSHFGQRMRMEKGRGYHFMPVYRLYDTDSQAVTSTNTNTYIPWDIWASSHPKWFSDKCSTGKYQLCYTGHGDPVEREALVQEVAKKIEFSLKTFTPEKYPEMSVITFTMEDNFNTCDCAECNRLSEYYGAQSGPLNLFVNDVGAEVEAWMNEPENAPYYRDDFHIIYFAYNAYEPAPAYFDEDEQVWKPTHPEVKLRSNVGVYFAEINIIDYQKSMFDPANKEGKDAFDAWEAISDFMYYWTYETNFAYLMYWYDTFDFYTQEMYNYCASKGIDMMFGEAQEFCGSNGINFNALKGYLDAKLQWDTTRDQEALMNDYFRAVFGDAQYKMREFFNLIRAHNQQVFEMAPDFVTNRSCYNMVRNEKYYPLTTLENFVSRVDECLEMIEKVKNVNPDLYEKLYAHIEAEAVSYLYIILDLHSSKLTIERKLEILNRLYRDIDMLSIQSCQIREAGNTIKSMLDGFKKTV